jgi:hypothetical protein
MNLLIPLALGAAWAGTPADRLPTPKPERCKAPPMTVDEDGDGPSYGGSEGLSYEQVVPVLQKTVQTALYCARPEGREALHLTFQITVGCDGVVSGIEATDDDDAPEAYLTCVMDVLRKADFPAHDMPAGMPITYPVDVSW